VLKITGRLLDPFRTWWWVRRHDVVLVAGMGILETTVPGKAWGFPLGLLCLAVASRITGTWFGLVCVGAEIDGDPVIRWMLRSTASMAQYRSYRDQLSRDAMRQVGVQVTDDEVYPDLVFGLTCPTPHRQPLLIGVGVMNFRGRSTNPARAAAAHEQYRKRITEVVQRLTADGWHVRLLIGDVEDIPVAEGIRSAVSIVDDTSRPPVEVALAKTIDELLAQLAETHVFIGTRYHNVLAALALGTPTLSVGYARKNRELMEAFGLGGFCQEAHLLDVALTLDQVRDAVEHHDTLSRLIRDRLPDMRQGVRDQLRALSEELQSLRRPVGPT